MIRVWVWLLRAECAWRERRVRRRTAGMEQLLQREQLLRDIRALPEIEPERIVPW